MGYPKKTTKLANVLSHTHNTHTQVQVRLEPVQTGGGKLCPDHSATVVLTRTMPSLMLKGIVSFIRGLSLRFVTVLLHRETKNEGV
jgi:hypothetical protein